MAITTIESPPPSKRRKIEPSLIEGLPDHISETCLSLVNRPSLLSSVCTRWRNLIYSKAFPPFPSLYTLFVIKSKPGSISNPVQSQSKIRFMCFDPVLSKWSPVPTPPLDSPLNRISHRHPSYISFNLPVQCVTVAEKLVVIAGSNQELSPAITHPLIFDPVTLTWSSGPKLRFPRRWCVTGAHDGVLYVASGIGSQFSTKIAKSIEKLDFNRSKADLNRNKPDANHGKPELNRDLNWEELREMRDLRFSREAIEAIGYRGKLLMVNVKGNAVKEGVIYDVVLDDWVSMPEEMLVGWRGPVTVLEEKLYSVDEMDGKVRVYEEEKLEWRDIIMVDGCEEKLIGASQVTAMAGKLCVVTADGRIVVADVMMEPGRIWNVNVPDGLEPVSVHVLPRMNRPDIF